MNKYDIADKAKVRVDNVTDVLHAIEELYGKRDWLPIETAPKKEKHYGEEIILSDGKDVFFGHWYKGKWYRRDCSDLMICEPTHWISLPEPPKI